MRFVLALLLPLSGCTYGPPHHYAKLENAAGRINTHTIAVALSCQRLREPTGLSTFPDGGSPRILEQAALIYVCDVDQPSTKLLARIVAPRGMEGAFEPWILGWVRDDIFVGLTGYRHSSLRGSVGPLIKQTYRVGLDGTCQTVEGPPDSLKQTPNLGIPMKGETNFMRLSKGAFDIGVRLEDGGPYTPLFEVNQAKCTLDAVSPSKAAPETGR